MGKSIRGKECRPARGNLWRPPSVPISHTYAQYALIPEAGLRTGKLIGPTWDAIESGMQPMVQ